MADEVYKEFKHASAAARVLAQETCHFVKIIRKGEGYVLVLDSSSQEIEQSGVSQGDNGSTLQAILYELAETDWEEATRRANNLPIYENSHREFDANVVGTLGEVVAEKWFKEINVVVDDERETTTHDYRLKNGRSIDVKTKDRTVRPQPHYDCSVPMYNHEHQRPDYYVFVSLERSRDTDSSARSFKYAYLLGISDQALLEQVGKVWQAGQVDPDNGTRFWTSCINIRISDLDPPEKAARILRACTSR